MPVQITILGLGQVGASFGLALAKIKDQVIRTGNDRDPGIARQAEKAGAVDKTVINLPNAVREADVVLLALPVDEIRETIEVIAQDLKPGSVLIDTSPAQSMVTQWAQDLLPGSDRYFVALTPSMNPAYLRETETGVASARADLFKNSLMLISSPQGIDESALTLASNLTEILGATALFTDPVEADGLIASSRLLPGLVSAALVNAVTGQPGWREARKMAGYAFATATEPALHPEERKALGQAALLNAENTLRMLDTMIAELGQLREEIAGQNTAAVQARLANAREARERWENQRLTANWEQKPEQPRMPTGGEVIGRLFGYKPKKDKEQKQ
ncbi:MAG: prephenate dehydrogenase [Chloroflexi bacterium]|nr:MAG: prephenate dehydrogenase [Chloroflexota bacterium]